MSDRFETYGSAELRISFINDEEGKLIKTDSLLKTYTIFGHVFMKNIKVFLFGTTQR